MHRTRDGHVTAATAGSTQEEKQLNAARLRYNLMDQCIILDDQAAESGQDEFGSPTSSSWHSEDAPSNGGDVS